MLDSSSSKTMNLDYLFMEPFLRIDDLDLISKFGEYYDSGRYIGDKFTTKVKEKVIESDAFARIIYMILS